MSADTSYWVIFGTLDALVLIGLGLTQLYCDRSHRRAYEGNQRFNDACRWADLRLVRRVGRRQLTSAEAEWLATCSLEAQLQAEVHRLMLQKIAAMPEPGRSWHLDAETRHWAAVRGTH